jgi:hypothetical protein
MLEITPEPIYETLLHEVIDVFSKLNHYLDHVRLRCLIGSKVR